jgi:hypothetical protein
MLTARSRLCGHSWVATTRCTAAAASAASFAVRNAAQAGVFKDLNLKSSGPLHDVAE